MKILMLTEFLSVFKDLYEGRGVYKKDSGNGSASSNCSETGFSRTYGSTKIKMRRHLQTILLAITTAKIMSKEPELPPCPANVEFFPQNLPMHCKMQKRSDQSLNPGMMPFPLPSGFPGFPGPGSPGVPGPEMPGLPGMPGPGLPGLLPPGLQGPGPMPMPMAGPGPAHKLPVIVMPFYSPDPAFKKPQMSKHKNKHRLLEVYTRRPPFSDDDSSDTDWDTLSDTSDDKSSDDRGWWKSSRGFRRSGKKVAHRHKRKHKHAKKDILTPILQYVTKDGYVIFEKKISKNEAKSWLSMKKENNGNENEHQVFDNPAVVPNDNNIQNPETDVHPDVEILETKKDKGDVEPLTSRAPVKKHYPHKKPSKIHVSKEVSKEEKDEASE